MKLKVLLLSLTTVVMAQDLKTCIGEVLQTNPVVQERLKNYNATKQNLINAKSGYYPKIDLSLGMGYEKTDRSALGNGTSNTQKKFNIYQNTLKLTQNIFNGFATDYQVQEQNFRKISAAYSYVEKANDRAFKMSNTYIELMKNRDLLETAQENVDIDKDILQKVQKLYDSGLTTLSEVNKVQSSLALAESNLIIQENSLLNAEYNLQRVLGHSLELSQLQKPTLHTKMPSSLEEAASFAIMNNPSLLVANYNIKLAKATHHKAKSPFYPKVDLEVSKSLSKNLSGVQGETNAFKAMAVLSYNLFNGFADETSYQATISQLLQELQSKNDLKRQVIEGLSLSWASYIKLSQQLKHLKQYKKFSLKTLRLYTKEYNLGRRSLLDLLSTQNDFIGAKSQIITAEYSLLFAKYRILDAMGILVSTLFDDKNIVYSKVALNGISDTPLDTLEKRMDSDNDLIPDEMDLCDNSLEGEIKNRYGCKETNIKGIKQVERYDGFLFEKKQLTQASKKRLSSLIKQLKLHKIAHIRFTLLGNAFNDKKSAYDLIHLSQQRALVVKEALMKAGATEKNIVVYANGNFSEPYIDNDQKNNRVDIVVKK